MIVKQTIKHVLVLVFLVVLSVQQCHAYEIQPIKKGEPAPIDGFVIDHEFEQARRKDRELLELERVKNVSLSDLNAVQDKQVQLYRTEAERANSELQKERYTNAWKTVGYFLLGVLSVSAGAWVANKVGR